MSFYFLCVRDRTVPTASSFQGTLIMANVDSALFDPDYWETPHQFNPGHFLDEGGNFVTREAFLAFSAGEYTESWAQVCGLDEAVLFSLWRRPEGSLTPNCRSTLFCQPRKMFDCKNKLFGNCINT